MECFAKIVNASQPLTILAKHSNLDVWMGSEHTCVTRAVMIGVQSAAILILEKTPTDICSIYVTSNVTISHPFAGGFLLTCKTKKFSWMLLGVVGSVMHVFYLPIEINNISYLPAPKRGSPSTDASS